MKSIKNMSCGISGLTLKEPSQLYYCDCGWLCSWPAARQPSWDFGSSSQKTRRMNSDFISVPLPLLHSFESPLLSPEVSGVQSSCQRGKGAKMSVWVGFLRSWRRTREWSGLTNLHCPLRMQKPFTNYTAVWYVQYSKHSNKLNDLQLIKSYSTKTMDTTNIAI